MEKGAVDSLGGTIKCSVWRYVKAGSNAYLDEISYWEIARQSNPNLKRYHGNEKQKIHFTNANTNKKKV